MKLRFFNIDVLYFLFIFLISVSPVNAALIPRSISELTRSADTIVTGTVVNMESEWDVERKTIFTYVTIETGQVLKNAPPKKRKKGEQITLRLEGGTVGDTTISTSEMPEFSLYEEVFLFLSVDTGLNPPSSEGDGLGDFTVRGWEMGKFTVINEEIEITDFKNDIRGKMTLGEFVKDINMILSGSDATPSFMNPQNLK
ncbi:MAG: hypothetical protein HYV24_05875 [Deltaproteobacteria bacterium]|nr:hypothetical protein [Deltaproteobacteria bacterium]